ncbi:MAG: hypothetical protein RSB38_08995 [Oscillospiraceae bacterium]
MKRKISGILILAMIVSLFGTNFAFAVDEKVTDEIVEKLETSTDAPSEDTENVKVPTENPGAEAPVVEASDVPDVKVGTPAQYLVNETFESQASWDALVGATAAPQIKNFTTSVNPPQQETGTIGFSNGDIEFTRLLTEFVNGDTDKNKGKYDISMEYFPNIDTGSTGIYKGSFNITRIEDAPTYIVITGDSWRPLIAFDILKSGAFNGRKAKIKDQTAPLFIEFELNLNTKKVNSWFTEGGSTDRTPIHVNANYQDAKSDNFIKRLSVKQKFTPGEVTTSQKILAHSITIGQGDDFDVLYAKDVFSENTIIGANANKDEIGTNLVLPDTYNGVGITWSSGNTAVISDSGVVTTPANNTAVTMTANFEKGGKTATKDFTLTVLAHVPTDAEKLAEAEAALTLASLLQDGQVATALETNIKTPPTTMGQVNVKWVSSDSEVMATDGTITRGARDAEVTLFATLTCGAEKAIKDFNFKVKAVSTGEVIIDQSFATPEDMEKVSLRINPAYENYEVDFKLADGGIQMTQTEPFVDSGNEIPEMYMPLALNEIPYDDTTRASVDKGSFNGVYEVETKVVGNVPKCEGISTGVFGYKQGDIESHKG